eukprot:TRINITY_DN104220_c0_g1_i1.p1 TRINITY_DN104220_c0_g1~~TRINITY_DN104220_c0_g1_i1.p1  ORF type:complete len:316 (-),score=21.60 TRINITY_DN104220_c0_g1_i1:87-1034(-)
MDLLLSLNDPCYLSTLYQTPPHPEFYEDHGITRELAANIFASWGLASAPYNLHVEDWCGALKLFKTYPTWFKYTGQRGREVTSDDARKMVWNVMDKTRVITEDVVQLYYPEVPRSDLYFNETLAVDCTHCPLWNVSHVWHMPTVDDAFIAIYPFFSWKKRGNALSYQLVFDHVNQMIVNYVNYDGGHPASRNDHAIWTDSGVSDLLLPHQKVLGDNGYWGGQNIVANANNAQMPIDEFEEMVQVEENKRISGRRWQVEACFGRLKKYRCLSTPWRHKITRHQQAFGLVCALWNLAGWKTTYDDIIAGDDDTDTED